eukprot:2735205-Ditylum_brightwellii.AAC.1
MRSIYAGKEDYNSIELDQRNLWPCWLLHIVASCGDSSSHTCSASGEASTHTGIFIICCKAIKTTYAGSMEL